jgi:hypothetical protein
VDGNLNVHELKFQYRPCTGSIKPSLQHFQFCRVGLSLGILYLPILIGKPISLKPGKKELLTRNVSIGHGCPHSSLFFQSYDLFFGLHVPQVEKGP